MGLLEKDEILRRLAEQPEDEAAWHDLYIEFWPFVFGTIYWLLNGKREQARDLSQDVFLRLAKYRPFKELRSTEKFRAYLKTTCRNVTYDFLRSTLRDPVFVELESIENKNTESRQGFEFRESFQHLYHSLGDADRRLLDLMIAGESGSEIAKRLNISEQTVRVRIHRLRLKTKRLVERRDK
jgi:RNA polymerase sigma factor (sigma-70 family)